MIHSTKDSEMDPDFETVRKCQAGDVKAFEGLVLKYQKPLFNIAYGYVGNRQDAEEVVQDTFISIYRNISSFRWESKFFTFLAKALYNRSMSLIGKRKRENTWKKELNGLNLNENSDLKALVGWFRHENDKQLYLEHLLKDAFLCIQQLSGKYLAIYSMQAFGRNFNYDDLAEIFDLNKNTIKTRVNRARDQVRGCVEEKHGEIAHAMQ